MVFQQTVGILIDNYCAALLTNVLVHIWRKSYTELSQRPKQKRTFTRSCSLSDILMILGHLITHTPGIVCISYMPLELETKVCVISWFFSQLNDLDIEYIWQMWPITNFQIVNCLYNRSLIQLVHNMAFIISINKFHVCSFTLLRLL